MDERLNKLKDKTDLEIANQAVSLCFTILMTVLAVSYLFEVFNGNRTIGYYALFMVLDMVPVVLVHILKRKNPGTPYIKHIIGYGFAVFKDADSVWEICKSSVEWSGRVLNISLSSSFCLPAFIL